MQALVQQLKANVEVVGFFPNDYSFHSAAVKIFNQLLDAHTQYRLPNGYLNGTFVRPLTLIKRDNLGWITGQGPLGDLGDSLYLQLFGIDLTKYQNQPVTRIDDEPVDSYVQRIADTYFLNYKDPQIRFNALVRRRGWAFVPLSRFTLDQFPETTKFTFSTAASFVKLPNFVHYPGGLADLPALMELNRCKRFCMNTTYVGAATNDIQQPKPRRDHSFNPHDEHEEIHRNTMQSLSGYARMRPQSVFERAKKKRFVIPGLQLQSSDSFNETQFFTMFHEGSTKLIPVLRYKTFAPRSFPSV